MRKQRGGGLADEDDDDGTKHQPGDARLSACPVIPGEKYNYQEFQFTIEYASDLTPISGRVWPITSAIRLM